MNRVLRITEPASERRKPQLSIYDTAEGARLVLIKEKRAHYISFLTYSPGHEFDVVRYDSILSALKEMQDSGDGPATPVIVVHTRQGKTYTWYRTLMQGIFDPDQVLLSIRRRAGLTRKIGLAYYRVADTDSNE